jgi:hypothetical protein
MDSDAVTRRHFLVAAISGFGVAACGLNPELIRTASAWADAHTAGSQGTGGVLAGMVHRYYPHSNVADEVYTQTADSILSAAASDPQLQQLLDTASAALDRVSDHRFAKMDAESQLAAMTSVQGEAFFTAIKFQVLGRFYANPEVWKAINYPGSSVEYGGYVDRGFNDIDWLPEEKQ